MIPSIPVPMQFSRVVFNPDGTASVVEDGVRSAQVKRAEIVERWKPSPPGTPEWEAQRNFDYARAHAHGDVKFLLEDSERLIQRYRKALALVLEMRGYITPTQEQFAPIMARIDALLAEPE